MGIHLQIKETTKKKAKKNPAYIPADVTESF